MAINPLIALSGEKLDTVTPLKNAQEIQTNQAKKELFDIEAANAKLEGFSAREKARYESVIGGAAELGTYLESGDIEGSERYLLSRRAELGKRIAAGDDVDTRETDEALAVIRSRDPEKIKQLQGQIGHMVKLGQMRGILDVPKEEGFNLSPGQTRYDANGTPIVNNPKLPDGATAVTNPETGEVTYMGGKALPISAAKGILENRDSLRKAETALQLISGENITDEEGNVVAKGDKEATGKKGYVPDMILQRVDKSGVDTRAAIADLGSMIIHDRSGAAVSASEYPRLVPFIPKDNDEPDVVRQKLSRFIREFEAINEEAEGFYSESGYNVPKAQTSNKAPASTKRSRLEELRALKAKQAQ